jgi:hypothetical protein
VSRQQPCDDGSTKTRWFICNDDRVTEVHLSAVLQQMPDLVSYQRVSSGYAAADKVCNISPSSRACSVCCVGRRRPLHLALSLHTQCQRPRDCSNEPHKLCCRYRNAAATPDTPAFVFSCLACTPGVDRINANAISGATVILNCLPSTPTTAQSTAIL